MLILEASKVLDTCSYYFDATITMKHINCNIIASIYDFAKPKITGHPTSETEKHDYISRVVFEFNV